LDNAFALDTVSYIFTKITTGRVFGYSV